MEKMAWNIESEYLSYKGAEFQLDYESFTQYISNIEELARSLSPAIEHFAKTGEEPQESFTRVAQEMLVLEEAAMVLGRNMATYLKCNLSVDSSLTELEGKSSELDSLVSQLTQTMIPLKNLLKRCSDELMQKILDHSELSASEFVWSQERKLKDFLLSDQEETLLTALSVPGMDAWGNLYTKLSGSLKCHLKYPDRTETVGLAQANGMIRSADPEIRRIAWHGIQEAWSEQKDSVAAVLNSLAGWRLEVNKKRSHKKPFHFLDEALFQSRIERQTLDAMLAACYENLPNSRKALDLMAKVMNKKSLDPWDLLAQSPVSGEKKQRSYDEAIALVKKSFHEIDPQMNDFIKMMDDNRWIEARVLPNKRNGAYCTTFAKKREPRVFMTYIGSNSDVSTLAHELGHAFHTWSMKDLPRSQSDYPMTLAETASIFAETVLFDALIAEAATKEEQIEFAWNEIEGAASLLINIPARFEFEKNFYEMRSKRALSADELTQLTDEAWTKWYGSTLSRNENLFWATKLHFSISDVSFYNFPYTFGYLFSMSIYARRKELGANFMQKYLDILRDTGRMTAEEVVQKHLGEDIRKPEFWKKSINVINEKIDAFEKLALG